MPNVENDFLNLEDLEEIEVDEEEEVMDDEEIEESDEEELESEDESYDEEPDEDSEEEEDEELPSSKKIDPKVMKELTEFPELIREDIAKWPENKRRALKLQQNRMNSRILKTEQEAKQIVAEKVDNEKAVVAHLTKLGDLLKGKGVTPEAAEQIKLDALHIATASYMTYEEGRAKQAQAELVPVMEDYFLDSFGEELADFHKKNPLVSRAIFASLRYTEPKARKRLLELMKPLVEAQLKRGKATKRKGGKPSSRKPRRTREEFDDVSSAFKRLMEQE